MKKLGLFTSVVLVLGTVLAVSCGGGAAPTATVTVTKTAPSTPGAAPTVTVTTTVTTTAPAVTATVTPTPTPPKLTQVKDAVPTGSTVELLAAAGREKGLFKERGIDHVPLSMAVAAARLAPFVGQADISQGDVVAFYPERKDARVIGPAIIANTSVLVRKDSPYMSFRDLRGKKFATLGPASATWILLKVLTQLEGLDLEKDFQLLTGVPATTIGWLLKGEVDAVLSFESFTSKALVSDGDKVRELHWLNDLYKKHTGYNFTLGAAYSSEAWVNKNPELARAVSRAYDDTFSYIYANPQVWKSEIARKVWQIDDPAVLEMLVQRLPRVVESPRYGPAYKAGLIAQTQRAADAGLIPREAVEWFKGTILFAEPW